MDEEQIYQAARLILEERGVDASRVLSRAIYPDRVALVLDHGGRGCPKHVVAMAEILARGPIGQPVVDATAMAVVEAEQLGVDLSDVEGTGPRVRGGRRVTVTDVRRSSRTPRLRGAQARGQEGQRWD